MWTLMIIVFRGLAQGSLTAVPHFTSEVFCETAAAQMAAKMKEYRQVAVTLCLKTSDESQHGAPDARE